MASSMHLHFFGTVSAFLYIGLAISSHAAGGPSLPVFYTLMFSLAFISFGLFLKLNRNDSTVSLGAIFFWAIVFRMIGVAGLPIYEDDFYRYLWDGYLFYERGSPYGIAPSDYFGNEEIPSAFQNILGGINYPEIPTIYGPLLQLSYLLAYLIAPGEVIALQALYSLADVALIIVLSKLTKPINVLLYAWCPLVVKEIAFTAHPDGLGILLVMMSFLALHRSNTKLALVLLGFAVAAKVFAILLIPFILLRTHFRDWYLLPLATLGCYLPFILYAGTDLAGLLAFANEWQFNSAFYQLMLNAFDFKTVKLLSAVLFCSAFAFLLWVYWKSNTKAEIPRGDIVFGVFFLLAPVVNAWYLVWLLAFAAIRPTIWAWTASVAVLLSYITGLTLGNLDMDLYQQPIVVITIEYMAVILVVLFGIKTSQMSQNARSDMTTTHMK